MKLESGKEMDRRCVMNWLNEVYVTPSRAFSKYTDAEIKMFAHDALVLLKEQEAMQVKTDMYGNAYCPWCSTDRSIEMGLQRLHLGTRFCPYCVEKVKWE